MRIIQYGITKATIVHFITTYVGFLPLAILAGWFPLTINYLIIFTIVNSVYVVLVFKELNNPNQCVNHNKDNCKYD
jgi:hypothetical protein